MGRNSKTKWLFDFFYMFVCPLQFLASFYSIDIIEYCLADKND